MKPAQIIQQNKSCSISHATTERIEKKCFVWKHKVHVIDPGILLWALRGRDWPAERARAPPTNREPACTAASRLV